MPLLALLMALAAAPPASAEVYDAGSKRVMEWVTTCNKEVQRFSDGTLSALGSTRTDLVNECLEVREPCARLVSGQDDPDMPERCRRLCGPHEFRSCEAPPPQMCVPGYEARTAPPPAPRAPPSPESYPTTSWGWINWLMADSIKNWGGDRKNLVNMAWAKSLDLRKKRPDDLALRNAEHYLWAYYDVLDGRMHKTWSIASCTLSYGYTAAKFLPGMRTLLSTDDKPATEPSMEEAEFGCSGARDAASGAYPW